MGIFVSGVQAGSPAEEQGIQEGDQILQVTWRCLLVGMLVCWVTVCYSLCSSPLGPLEVGVTHCLCPYIVVPVMTLRAGVCDPLSVSVYC